MAHPPGASKLWQATSPCFLIPVAQFASLGILSHLAVRAVVRGADGAKARADEGGSPHSSCRAVSLGRRRQARADVGTLGAGLRLPTSSCGCAAKWLDRAAKNWARRKRVARCLGCLYSVHATRCYRAGVKPTQWSTLM